jgi:hypothetical protein
LAPTVSRRPVVTQVGASAELDPFGGETPEGAGREAELGECADGRSWAECVSFALCALLRLWVLPGEVSVRLIRERDSFAPQLLVQVMAFEHRVPLDKRGYRWGAVEVQG